MQIARPAGREGASRKYDILTALAVQSLKKPFHVPILSFMAL